MDKPIKVMNVIVIAALTALMTIVIVSIIWEKKSIEKQEKIDGLEVLVEFHQKQTFELLQELQDLKEVHKE